MKEVSKEKFQPKKIFKATTVLALGLSVLAGCGESSQNSLKATKVTTKSPVAAASAPKNSGTVGPLGQSGSESSSSVQFPPAPSQNNFSKLNWQVFTENANNNDPNASNPTTALEKSYYAGPCVPIRNLDGTPLWTVRPGEMLMMSYPVTNGIGAWIFKIVNSTVDTKDYYLVEPDGTNTNVNYDYPMDNTSLNDRLDSPNRIDFVDNVSVNQYGYPLINYSEQNNFFTFDMKPNATIPTIAAGTAVMQTEVPVLVHDFAHTTHC